MKGKLYEVSGVIEYAHAFSEEVMATSPEDAQKKVKENLEKHIDSSMAEHSDETVDLGVEIK